MRINQFVANATDMSRRAVDKAISEGRVKVNNQTALIGQAVDLNDNVTLDNRVISANNEKIVLLINKPVGYVCSRDGQGSKTIYDLIPAKYSHLNYAGRLDKDSSGLVVMSNNGDLINKLSHPSFSKQKTYQIKLNKPLSNDDMAKINRGDVILDERPSLMKLNNLSSDNLSLRVEMSEGRNRQIRKTFSSLGYDVLELTRTKLGQFTLEQLNGLPYRDVSDINSNKTLVNS